MCDSPRHKSFFKIVYFGPPLAGKTTNCEVMHRVALPSNRGDISSILLKYRKCLYLDFLYTDEKNRDVECRIVVSPNFNNCPCSKDHLTQEMYEEDMRVLLKGVDGVVFVADSQIHRIEENVNSLEMLGQILTEM